MAIPEPLAITLAMIAQGARAAEDDWWIIGSAAVALHGAFVTPLKDVDVMMSYRDAERFLTDVNGDRIVPEPSALFQSDIFGVWTAPPIPVEIFGGFRLACNEGWQSIGFTTRLAMAVDGGQIYIPGIDDLRGLLRSFGRPKDLERLRLIEA
ncbi:hypothetical protein ACFSC3_03180 [Sphingomonas floccifaciens]|uniref:Nucleotidyltransferase family protein n=1 Tax=Sphingomonas floccifaciens TaxID=1844115 RepID=A0ABW4N9K1_9SPHN